MKALNTCALTGILLSFSFACFANGGPVDWTEGKPVGGLVPKEESAVELVREALDISIVDVDRYAVEANYVLKNSGAARRISYGVPLYWVEEFQPEAAAAGIHIAVGEKEYGCIAVSPVKRTDLNAMESSEWIGAVGDAWCVAEIEIPQGPSVRLKLSYEAEFEFEDWETSKSARREFSSRRLVYPLAPAGYWNGKPDLELRLNLGPYADRVSKLEPPKLGGQEAVRTNDAYTWTLAQADLKQLKALEVDFDFEPLLRHRQLATWNADALPARTTRAQTSASSTLSHEKNRYAVENLMDGDPATAWCEGSEGNGEGESITFRIEPKENEYPCSVEGIAIVPGYAKSAQTYLKNGRVTRLRIEECDDPSSYAELRWQAQDRFEQSAVFIDTDYASIVPTGPLVEAKGGKWAAEESERHDDHKPYCLRFIILETAPGEDYSDTCISEVAFIRNCG